MWPPGGHSRSNKICFLRVKYNFKLSLDSLDQHLLMSKEWPKATNTRPSSPAWLISPPICHKTKLQLVDFNYSFNLNYWFLIDSDHFSTQYLVNLHGYHWNQTHRRSGRPLVRNLYRSRSTLDWLITRPKNGRLQQFNQVESLSTDNPLMTVSRIHAIYILALPQYISLVSIETSPISMRTTTAILDTGPGYIISSYSEANKLARHMCPDYKILLREMRLTSLEKVEPPKFL